MRSTSQLAALVILAFVVLDARADDTTARFNHLSLRVGGHGIFSDATDPGGGGVFALGWYLDTFTALDGDPGFWGLGLELEVGPTGALDGREEGGVWVWGTLCADVAVHGVVETNGERLTSVALLNMGGRVGWLGLGFGDDDWMHFAQLGPSISFRHLYVGVELTGGVGINVGGARQIGEARREEPALVGFIGARAFMLL